MRLETERLVLRELTNDDFAAWYAILSDAETMKHYPAPFDEEKVRQWISWNLENYQTYGFGLWAVILKKENRFIGDCGMTMQCIHGRMLPEIGYHIKREYQRRGYASEAAQRCMRYAFEEEGLRMLTVYHFPWNDRSRRVIEKCGFRKEGTLRESFVRFDGTLMDEVCYSLTAEEWQEGRKC